MHKSSHNGRGALSNREGRFETTRCQSIDDGWTQEDPESLPSPATIIKPEPAASIISRNQSPDIPFSQSINPYRGCEHGCIYCLAGDTPILMADGHHRPLAKLRPGDEIYGTRRVGRYRRYVKTCVLAHWSVIKPAYRIMLADGTQLIAGAEHRFLTERGWKFVDEGDSQRPHLTLHNKLMGTGAFVPSPAKDADYARGYLCGLIRGDGHLASCEYVRARRTHGNQYQYRLALCDHAAQTRAQRYLREFEIYDHEFLFQNAAGKRRRMYAIRTHAQVNVTRIRELIDWPALPMPGWRAGFLAGMFDAEGSYSCGILRISNTDTLIIDWLKRCLLDSGFDFAPEQVKPAQRRPITVLRLRGGLREHLRFFHSTDPAIRRKCGIEGHALKCSVQLQVTHIEALTGGMRLYDITTGTGDFIANGVLSHNCYARPSHAYLNLSPGLDFETRLFYKPQAAELLDRELRRPGYRCSPIALGANTDPYQPMERKLSVTRSLLAVLQRFHHPVIVITKGTLITRDLDILADMARQSLASVMISVTTLDDSLKRRLEPRTPSGSRRLQTIKTLSTAGIPVGVLTAPIIPMVNDAEMERILGLAAEAGASCAGYVLLRLPHELKDLFREWLEQHMPDRAGHVMSLVRQSRGGRDYDAEFTSRMRGTGEYAALIEQRFNHACKKFHLRHNRHALLSCAHFHVPNRYPQLDLNI